MLNALAPCEPNVIKSMTWDANWIDLSARLLYLLPCFCSSRDYSLLAWTSISSSPLKRILVFPIFSIAILRSLRFRGLCTKLVDWSLFHRNMKTTSSLDQSKSTLILRWHRWRQRYRLHWTAYQDVQEHRVFWSLNQPPPKKKTYEWVLPDTSHDSNIQSFWHGRSNLSARS